jgi:hypothetical protein
MSWDRKLLRWFPWRAVACGSCGEPVAESRWVPAIFLIDLLVLMRVPVAFGLDRAPIVVVLVLLATYLVLDALWPLAAR